METSPVIDFNHTIAEAFVQYLLTLSPKELTQFYCENCIEQLNFLSEYRPTSPYQEDTGRCANCQLHDDVSNPYINLFLNAHGLTLAGAHVIFHQTDKPFSRLEKLICNWLIADDYVRFRENDRYPNTDPQSSWVRYGRKMYKKAYRDSYLSQANKDLLLDFYPRCYSAERYAAAPIEEVVDEVVMPTLAIDTFVSSSDPVTLVDTSTSQQVGEQAVVLTFERFKAFLASILYYWKGNGNQI